MASTPGMAKASNISTNRQKPKRLPYSCQAQFGTWCIGAPPAGGVITVRGIGWVASHSSTLMTTHTAMRAPFGSLSAGRSATGENGSRSVGSITGLVDFRDVDLWDVDFAGRLTIAIAAFPRRVIAG